MIQRVNQKGQYQYGTDLHHVPAADTTALDLKYRKVFVVTFNANDRNVSAAVHRSLGKRSLNSAPPIQCQQTE